MGKYLRKAKVSGEVAVMEVASAPLGVRTRARALALQRMQKQQARGGGGRGGEKEGAGGDYLELRSRRLEKLPPPVRAGRRGSGRKAAAAAAAAQEEEASFGENMLELEGMERSTRETTPCNSLINSETISTPGSTTKPSHSSHRRVQAPVQTIPISKEFKEFFSAAERRQQQAFIDKYNFDPVNDCPLPGRYEWVKLD